MLLYPIDSIQSGACPCRQRSDSNIFEHPGNGVHPVDLFDAWNILIII
jgi:hypothetical protein